MRHDLYDKLVLIQRERQKVLARRRLTDLLCAGKRMNEAIAECQRESPALGIAAEEVAVEERGYSPLSTEEPPL